jgi:branched-chain amino acid aminotransferase
MELARMWGMDVEERPIAIQERMDAHAKGTLTEAFGTGTAAVISPIGSLSWNDVKITVADGQTGPLAKKLYQTLTDIQFGRAEGPEGWVTEVK